MKKKTLLTRQAQEFAEGLSMRSQAELRRLRDKLEEDGRLVSPYGEKVEGHRDLFAIRLVKGQNVRFFYCYDDGVYIWILSGYEKKRQSIPLNEIAKALAIKKELGL